MRCPLIRPVDRQINCAYQSYSVAFLSPPLAEPGWSSHTHFRRPAFLLVFSPTISLLPARLLLNQLSALFLRKRSSQRPPLRNRIFLNQSRLFPPFHPSTPTHPRPITTPIKPQQINFQEPKRKARSIDRSPYLRSAIRSDTENHYSFSRYYSLLLSLAKIPTTLFARPSLFCASPHSSSSDFSCPPFDARGSCPAPKRCPFLVSHRIWTLYGTQPIALSPKHRPHHRRSPITLAKALIDASIGPHLYPVIKSLCGRDSCAAPSTACWIRSTSRIGGEFSRRFIKR